MELVSLLLGRARCKGREEGMKLWGDEMDDS